ncbi:protease pro-enzyme activation domain-containing protein [Candidatus Korobacter versatilis]|nr:protease pro-enzyme activation domain-containing protein [Candidatus Koribacter versatilis]
MAQVASRVTGDLNSSARVQLKGTASPLVARSTDKGRLPGERNLGRMVLLLAPTTQQDAAAKALVKDLHDSSSPNFHKWLTPAEFGKRFGVSENDAAAVRTWLESNGLTVHEVADGRRFIVFSGSVSQVEKTFATEMHSYSRNGKEFIANASEIKIPAALAPVVKGVVRLHSDPPKSQAYMGKKVHWDPTSGQWEGGDGSHYLAPADFAKIYNLDPLYKAGIDGTGQTIAIVGRGNIFLSDVQNFRTLFNLPVNDPEIIVNGDNPGETSGDVPEATLDVTWSGAVAPNAHIKFVVSQSNFSDGVDVSAAYIVDHNLAPVMSTSFGLCEAYFTPVQNAFYNALWQQAAAQGITSFVSAGDNGGAGCDEPGGGTYAFNGLNVSGLASTPYNVAVGGTQFDDTDDPTKYWASTSDPTTGASALGYIPEKVWNESSNDPNSPGLWAGSGGVSSLYKQPDWQTVSTSITGGMRALPDISLTAAQHDGYLVCLFQNCSYGEYFYVFGGTSASSPAAAGIMALVNQKMGGQPQGMANYVFYKLASTPGVFHDTTVGDNKVPDASGMYTVGYDAVSGYDLATGLGSFDANALVNNWAAASSGNAATVTLAVAPGQAKNVEHGTAIPFTTTVKCSGTGCEAPTGAVTLQATSSSSSVGIGTGALTPSSTGSVANVTSSAIPGGSYTVAARYGGDGTYYAADSNGVGFSVTPEASYSLVGSVGAGVLTIAPITVQYGEPINMGAIVAGNSGAGYPSGNLSIRVDGAPATTIAFDPGYGSQTPSALKLNYGENSNILMPGITTQSQSSTVSYLPTYWDNSSDTSHPLNEFHAGPHVAQVTYPGDASFAANTSNAFAFNVSKADTFIADFFPLGTQVANVPVHLMGEVLFISQWFGVYTGTVSITDVTSGTPVVLGSAPISMQYGGSYDVTVKVSTPGDNECGNPGANECHVLIVKFSGDRDTTPSSGKYFVPFPAMTSNAYISLGSDVPSAIAGAPVNLIAQVQSDVRTYTATGSVTFYDGATALGTAALDATGTATLNLTTLAPGVHSNITAVYSGDAVLASVSGGPYSVAIQDYTLTADPATLSITSGSNGTAQINMLPIGGSTQTVQLSCGSLPSNMSCTFAPSSVTLDGTNVGTTTLTIITGPSSTAANHGAWWATASTIALGLLFVPFTRRKRMKSLLGFTALMAVMVAGIGCGSNSSTALPPSKNVTAGTYTVSLTASGGTGSAAKTIPLVVTVK